MLQWLHGKQQQQVINLSVPLNLALSLYTYNLRLNFRTTPFSGAFLFYAYRRPLYHGNLSTNYDP